MRNTINDIFLSLLSGIALLIATRIAYDFSVDYLPDALLLDGDNPLGRLAFARFLLFTVLVAVLAPPLAWWLTRHAARRELSVALPGAACATVLFLLLEHAQGVEPFPRWLDPARAAVLFVALPFATRLFWWRQRRRQD